MFRYHVCLALRVLGLLAGSAILGVTILALSAGKQGTGCPGKHPHPRHIVLNNARGYCGLRWVPDADSVAGRRYNYTVSCTPPVTAGYQYTGRFAAQTPVVGMAYK